MVFLPPDIRREPMRLQQLVKAERRPRDFDPRQYISTWTEKDLLQGKVVDAWAIIFRTRGCYWARASGCSMCGYVNDVAQEIASSDLRSTRCGASRSTPTRRRSRTRPGRRSRRTC